MPDLLTPDEIADQLKVSKVTVMRYLKSGRLKGHQLAGKLWRVYQRDLDTFISATPEESDVVPEIPEG